MMNGIRKSDSLIVPKKPSNKEAGRPVWAERVEERGLGKGKAFHQTRSRTQGREILPNAMERIRQAAEKEKDQQFTSLFHHVYAIENLEESYREMKRKAAPGIDGITRHEYGEDLEKNLQDLSDRLKRGAYRAMPVKRVYIPKPDGRQRPIGITTLEDKIVQRAATRVLEAIYEADFKGFSYGFRPNRGAHDALDALTVGLTQRKVNWVLDADIRGFFDAISHEWLMKFIKHRIADKRVIRLIKKWLKAGVMEEGQRKSSEEGTPQGGSISPLLANIYLHYVFDLWIDHWRRNRAKGDIIVVRYADDFVIGFQYKWEADHFVKKLQERFNKFHLELHEGKTRLIEFGRFATERRKEKGEGKPETFDFLGFTFICSKNRHGRFRILRQNIRKRMRAKLKAIRVELRRRLHDPIRKTGRWLRTVIKGYYQYYGVPLNSNALGLFHHLVCKAWYHALRRRSQKSRITWKRMKKLSMRWLPLPRIVHPYPDRRLRVKT